VDRKDHWRRALQAGPRTGGSRQLGVDAEFTGAVAPDSVPGLLHECDAAAAPYPQPVPGRDDYFSPLKVYEYLAAGMPVVAPGVGQIPSILEDGRTGLLVAPGDPSAFAAALLRLAVRTPSCVSAWASRRGPPPSGFTAGTACCPASPRRCPAARRWLTMTRATKRSRQGRNWAERKPAGRPGRGRRPAQPPKPESGLRRTLRCVRPHLQGHRS
jgi:hypothetical protein